MNSATINLIKNYSDQLNKIAKSSGASPRDVALSYLDNPNNKAILVSFIQKNNVPASTAEATADLAKKAYGILGYGVNKIVVGSKQTPYPLSPSMAYKRLLIGMDGISKQSAYARNGIIPQGNTLRQNAYSNQGFDFSDALAVVASGVALAVGQPELIPLTAGIAKGAGSIVSGGGSSSGSAPTIAGCTPDASGLEAVIAQMQSILKTQDINGLQQAAQLYYNYQTTRMCAPKTQTISDNALNYAITLLAQIQSGYTLPSVTQTSGGGFLGLNKGALDQILSGTLPSNYLNALNSIKQKLATSGANYSATVVAPVSTANALPATNIVSKTGLTIGKVTIKWWKIGLGILLLFLLIGLIHHLTKGGGKK